MNKVFKKVLIGVLAMTATLTNAIALSACGDDDSVSKDDDSGTHTHSYQVSVVPPTCTESGYTLHTCTCGDNYRDNEVVATGHKEVTDSAVAATCVKTGLTEGKHCSVCQTILVEQNTTSTISHRYSNGVCSVCKQTQTEELEYTLSDDEQYYIVSGIGTVTDTKIIIASEYSGLPVTSIGDYAFDNSDNLTSVTIPDTVTSIGIHSFSRCNSITSITIGKNVTSIGEWAFYNCVKLANITIESSAIEIGAHAFEYTDFYFNESNWDNGVLYIGKHLIDRNQYLSGDYVIKQGTLTIADEAFYNCGDLTSVTIPNSVTSIGAGAFDGCFALTSVVIPDSVKTIGDSAFGDCDCLESVTLPKNLTTISEGMFSLCSSLTSIVIPSSVTYIGNLAFYSSGLTSVTIPASVTYIGESAFYNCDNLESVTFEITRGWCYCEENYDNAYIVIKESISSDSLSDPSTAAEYLRSTYYDYWWERS